MVCAKLCVTMCVYVCAPELPNKPGGQASGYPWISDPKTPLPHINLLGHAVCVLVCIDFVQEHVFVLMCVWKKERERDALVFFLYCSFLLIFSRFYFFIYLYFVSFQIYLKWCVVLKSYFGFHWNKLSQFTPLSPTWFSKFLHLPSLLISGISACLFVRHTSS